MNVVVIGAGIVGCSVAYFLAESGCSVRVVDGGEVAGGTTAASFAWLNSNAKEPRGYHALNVAGMDEHKRFANESPSAPWYHASGNFEWSRTEEGQAKLEAKVNRLRDWGYGAEWVSPEALKRLEPDVSVLPAATTRVAHYPDEAWVDAPRLSSELLRRAVRSRATIDIGREVVSMEVDGDNRIAQVVTDADDRFDADVVVVCAGPATAKVLSLAGASLPMRNRAGLIAVSTPVGVGLKSILRAPGVSIRPYEGGRLLIQARVLRVPTTEPLAPADAHRVGERALADAAEVVPALRGANVETTKWGVRPIPHDGFPVVGLFPQLQNLYVAVTHSGVTLALLLGRLIASEIASNRPQSELAPFRPERFTARRDPRDGAPTEGTV